VTEDLSTKLEDIKQIEFIIKYCSQVEDAVQVFGSDEEDFLGNVHYQNACAFALSQIGEHVKQLSHGLRKKYSEIEWKEIAGFRDILSHDYPGVNLSTFWDTVTKEVPKLKNDCEIILRNLK